MAATAMIDRLVHHAEILSLKGDSYRLRGKDLDARIGAKTRRNRLTDHPRHPRRGAADADYAPADQRQHANPAPTGPGGGAQAATSSARRYAPSLRSQPLIPHDPDLHVATRVGHFSTGASGPLFDRP